MFASRDTENKREERGEKKEKGETNDWREKKEKTWVGGETFNNRIGGGRMDGSIDRSITFPAAIILDNGGDRSIFDKNLWIYFT